MAKVYSKNPDVVFRKIADECILVPVKRNVGDLENIFTVNEVAARIWELVDGKRNEDILIGDIVREFEVSAGTADDDVRKFLGELDRAGLIEEV